MNNCGKCGKMWQDVFINPSRARRNSSLSMQEIDIHPHIKFQNHPATSCHPATLDGNKIKNSLGKYSKFFSARQVALIVEYLGEP